MRLDALQRDFQATLLGTASGFDTQVVDTPRAGSAERLDIYVQAYRLRLLDTLAGDYTGLAVMLGDAQFEKLGRAYIDAHPSHHPSLRWLGRHMADFLAATPPWRDNPLLIEMAAFEWAQGEVFDAADEPAVAPADIAGLPPQSWPGLRLRPHPALRRLDLAWNVPAIWRALSEDAEPPPPHATDAPQGWLLWRRDLDIHWRSLEEDECWCIDAWRNGACFAQLCEGLCQWFENGQVATRAAMLLKGWVNAGLVAALLAN